MSFQLGRGGRRLNRFQDTGLGDDDDPLSGVANMLDVGLLLSLFSTYRLENLFVQDSQMTIMKQSAEGELEIITKKGQKIEAVRITKSEAGGRGTRLGVAYQLEDGSMVYIPEGALPHTPPEVIAPRTLVQGAGG